MPSWLDIRYYGPRRRTLSLLPRHPAEGGEFHSGRAAAAGGAVVGVFWRRDGVRVVPAVSQAAVRGGPGRARCARGSCPPRLTTRAVEATTFTPAAGRRRRGRRRWTDSRNGNCRPILRSISTASAASRLRNCRVPHVGQVRPNGGPDPSEYLRVTGSGPAAGPRPPAVLLAAGWMACYKRE